MRNIFKDLVDVAKYKKQRNTAINDFETIRDKYVELLEKSVKQYDSMERKTVNFNEKLTKLTERVSNLETKRKK